ncbi:MAG: DUF29 domain-containing protein [Spirulina sp.]
MVSQFLQHQLPDLYDRDYYLWLQATVNHLQDKNFAQLDIENLIEEIESMGKREKRAVESNLVIVLLHLLKWNYQPELRSRSWKATVREHRRRLRKDLQESPSLKNYLQEVFAECYQDAREAAADETGLSLNHFPIESPFSPDDALHPNYLDEDSESE